MILSEPFYLGRNDLNRCEELFRRNYWPFMKDIGILDITLNEYRHYYATTTPENEMYLDRDINIIDKVRI